MGQAKFQSKLLAQDGYQHVNTDRNPDLRLDSVLGGSEKVFDPQVLLDPFEEQFYSPSAFVKLRNSKCGQVKVIGQKYQSLVLFRVPLTDAAETIRVMPDAFVQTQPDHLIAADARASVHRARLQTIELQAVFAASDEERSRPLKAMEPPKIHITTVHHVERSRLGHQFVQHAPVGHFSLGNPDQGGNRAAQVQQRIELKRRLGGAEAGPRKQAQAKINRGGIQGVNGLRQLDGERFVGVEAAGAGDQYLRQVVVDTPVPRAIGVGQRTVGDGRTKAHPIELVWARTQADFYVRQAIPVSDLGEGHGQELVPTGEVTNPIVALVAVDTTAKLFAMNPVHDLTENWLFGAHAASLAPPVLRKNHKRSRNQSHRSCCANRSYSNPSSKRRLPQPDDSEAGYRCQAEQHGIHQWRNTSLPCNAKITNNIHLGAAKSSNRAAPAQDSCVLLNLTKFQYLKKSNRVNFASGHPPSSHSELS